MLAVGDTVLFGKYQVCRVLGEGRSGTVYKARHVILDQYRAIKQVSISQDSREDPGREAAVLKGLRHPGIPIIYDIYRTDQHCFIVEEYLEGESLYALVSREGSLSRAKTISIGIQLCRIISYLHHSADEPILHLDLQPKNLLLCQDALKLIDFDQAVFMSHGSSPATRRGTVGCAAPEQYGREPLDERTDIYAIGALLFYMRKGVFPAAKSAPGEVPDGLTAVVERCLRKKREERYGDVDALLDDLISLRDGENPGHIPSSLIIAFAGCRSGIGATHGSLGLAAYLADRGIPALYEENNDSGAAWQLADEAGVCPDGKGIVYVSKWQLLPSYGDAVRLPVIRPEEFPVRIRDYGGQWEEAAGDMDADAVCLVCGGKGWEWESAAMAVHGLAPGGRLALLLNHMGEREAAAAPAGGLKREISAAAGKIPALSMPFFPRPDRLGTAERGFFEVLWRELLRIAGGSDGDFGGGSFPGFPADRGFRGLRRRRRKPRKS